MDGDWVVDEHVDILEKAGNAEVEDETHWKVVGSLDAAKVDRHDENEGDGREGVEGDDGDGHSLDVLFGPHNTINSG